MKSTPFILSLCIPTYNSYLKLCDRIKPLLIFDDPRLEIVIVDNSSTDGTYDNLKLINNKRLSIYKNETNCGAILNFCKALESAKGKYAMLYIDKDNIDTTHLSELINLLDNSTVLQGYCALNLKNVGVNIKLRSGFESASQMAYRSGHPTGNFFLTSALKNSKSIVNILENNDNYVFSNELISGELAFIGESLIINLPLFYFQTAEEDKKQKASFFTGKNLYFTPDALKYQLKRQFTMLEEMPLNKHQYRTISIKIFKKNLHEVSIGYKRKMNDLRICVHYNIEPKRINQKALLNNIFISAKAFLILKKPKLGIGWKIKVVVSSTIKVIVKLLIDRFSRQESLTPKY